jgi:hypothetical protein
MPLAKKTIRNALIQLLNDKGFTFTFEGVDDFYMIQRNPESRHISYQLVISGKTTIKTHGSHNGNKIDGIGVFRFDFYTGKPLPDYFIFGFENRVTGSAEFVNVSYSELLDRLTKRSLLKENKVEMWLWLMPDRSAYETTFIGFESEWWHINGRMAEGGEMDYSSYLNNWNELIDKLIE